MTERKPTCRSTHEHSAALGLRVSCTLKQGHKGRHQFRQSGMVLQSWKARA